MLIRIDRNSFGLGLFTILAGIGLLTLCRAGSFLGYFAVIPSMLIRIGRNLLGLFADTVADGALVLHHTRLRAGCLFDNLAFIPGVFVIDTAEFQLLIAVYRAVCIDIIVCRGLRITVYNDRRNRQRLYALTDDLAFCIGNRDRRKCLAVTECTLTD